MIDSAISETFRELVMSATVVVGIVTFVCLFLLALVHGGRGTGAQ